MNYWKQFAEMLGLELEQEFSLIRPDGRQENKNTYKIIEDGIYYKSERHSAWWAPSAEILEFLLMGDIKAVPLPWKPKDGEHYWYCSATREPVAVAMIWTGISGDLCKWKCGNCFRTKEETETKGKEIMEQIAKEFEKA